MASDADMDRLKSRIENYAIIRAKVKGFSSCTVDKDDLKSLRQNAYYDKSIGKLKVDPGLVLRCHPGRPITAGIYTYIYTLVYCNLYCIYLVLKVYFR